MARGSTLVPALQRLAAGFGAPLSLFGVALAVHLWATVQVGFPVNEGSAYYVAVARNLVEGRGLVVDAIWSYATPPLVLPRPAFELWQPLASFIAAVPMALLGTSFEAAQLGMAVVGALLAPLAWLVTLEATEALGTDARRARVLAVGGGVVVAVLGPLLSASALPDSTIPFAVAGVICCWLIARSAKVDRPLGLSLPFVLGVALGVAWLARQDAVWLGLVALVAVAAAGRLSPRFLVAVLGGGALITAPWLVRNLLVFGTPLTGQAIENALLTSNEQIFAYLTRPTLDAFLGQGAGMLVGNILAGAAHNIVNVLLIPAAPVAIAGLISAVVLWRHAPVRRSTLGILLVSGALIFAVTSVVFPIASLWGTFEHAAGPLLVGLAVAAVIGLDRVVVAVGRRRAWQNANAWLAPLALVALALPLAFVQLTALGAHAALQAESQAALARTVAAQPEVAAGQRPAVISDHPLWLSEATGLPALALPAEPPSALIALAKHFDARLVALSDTRGGYPALLRSAEATSCFEERTLATGMPPDGAVFAISEACRR